jgi:hypothetical protein
MGSLFFVLVILFATPDGAHHEALSFFDSAAACEKAKPDALIQVVTKAGAVEIGMACTSGIDVAKIS